MKMAVPALPRLEAERSQPMLIQTTLYDLIAAVGEVVEPEDGDLITTVVHLLTSHRVTPLGHLGN